MPFEIQELESEADFEADFAHLIGIQWKGFENPLSRLLLLFFPVFGPRPVDRFAALEKSIERQLVWHRTDPTSHWLKASDTESGEIIGGACWHIFTSNPYADKTDHSCTWWPDGDQRDFANTCMTQFLRFRQTNMARPHLCK